MDRDDPGEKSSTPIGLSGPFEDDRLGVIALAGVRRSTKGDDKPDGGEISRLRVKGVEGLCIACGKGVGVSSWSLE